MKRNNCYLISSPYLTFYSALTFCILMLFANFASALDKQVNILRNDFIEPVHHFVDVPTINETPGQLSSFSGSVSGCQIELNWETTQEIGNDFFEIERSIDGKRFFPIGSVRGAGNSISNQNYHFDDRNIYKHDYYYRLKLVDFNGGFFYSNIIKIGTACHREGIAIDNILPNPNVKNWINVKVFTDKDVIDAKLVIKDANQNHMQMVNAIIKPGLNIVPFNSKDLSRGTYMVQLLNDDNTEPVSMAFVKQ